MNQPTKYRSIKELAPKPSDAVRAMIDGLQEFSKSLDFQVAMDTFGRWDNGICFACAATCALYKLAGRSPTDSPKSLEGSLNRLRFLRIDYYNWWVSSGVTFEGVMDRFRTGNVYPLFLYYEVDPPEFVFDNPVYTSFGSTPWYLNNLNWREELPQVEDFYKRLVDLGL